MVKPGVSRQPACAGILDALALPVGRDGHEVVPASGSWPGPGRLPGLIRLDLS
jgi:hypothetical protein